MIKKNKWKILISSLIMLIPTAVGFILWDKFPPQLPIHWGANGQIDGWGSPMLAVVVLPLIILGIYWLCLFFTSLDKRQVDQNPKALGMIFWLMPFISLFASGVIYAAAFGMELDFSVIICVPLGVMFLIIGNYMPKCKQNYTLGVKIKWTLSSEENWSATHRFTGKIWVITGVLTMLCAFLPVEAFPFVALGMILLAAIPPVVYSYCYYKKQIREGNASAEDFKNKPHYPRWAIVLSIIFVTAIFAFCAIISFTGDVTVSCGDTSFTVEASYYNDLTVNYADIDSIEYREGGVNGSRVSGFGSPRLLLGWFKNDEFGNYTRYTYGDLDIACVVVTVDDKILVIGGCDTQATKSIYDELTERMGK